MFEIGGAGQRAFNSASRAAFGALFRCCTKTRCIRLEPIPPQGPLLLACNHISHFDPPLAGSLFPRHVDWMAMEELFRSERFARWLRLTGAFPVDRGGADRSALRVALRRLQAGRVVGIFPEGGIRAGEASILNGAEMRPGIGLLAEMSRAPVLPSVLVGTDRLYLRANWLRRPPVWFLTGAPVPPPSGAGNRDEERRKFRDRLAEAFQALKGKLLREFGVEETDLPQTPQARKGEDPYA